MLKRLPWWSKDKTAAGLQKDVAAYCGHKEIERLFQVSTAIDAVVFAAYDEDVIDTTHLTTEERCTLERQWSRDELLVATGRIGVLCKHLRALKFLLYGDHQCLTINLLLKTHAKMMEGETCAGMIRTGPVHSGNYTFLQADRIIERLVFTIEQANACKACDDDTIYDKVAKVFYDFVCIHPYEDGNGRIGRLIVSYIMLQSGKIKFPLPFYDGSKRSRQHYQYTISHFTRMNEPWTMLGLYVLDCVYTAWKNI